MSACRPLSSPLSSNDPACVKASYYFRKRPDVSFEHFDKHWGSVHADLTIASEQFAKYNCIRYVQVCQCLVLPGPARICLSLRN